METSLPQCLWVLTLELVILAGCSVLSPRASTPTPAAVLTETCPCAPKGEIEVTTNTVYYRISGSTAEMLRAQMDERGYVDAPGRRWDAYTGWNVHWSYPYAAARGGCVPGRVKTRVEVTFTLPQWDVPARAPEELVNKWQDYLATLQQHEEGHKEIAVAAGCEILRTISALRALPSCDALEQAADTAGAHVLERYRQQEASYDQETRHGATQGARFP